MQIDISIVVTISLFIVGGFVGLLKMLRASDIKNLEKEKVELNELKSSVKEFKESQENFREKLAKLELSCSFIEKELNATSSSIDYEEKNNRTTLENFRENLADVRETIAGFGRDYITRKEYIEEKKCNSNSSIRK